jgi:hypothetical protein
MNAQKLAIAIGVFKERKCLCEKPHSEPCELKMALPIIEIDGVKNITCNIQFYNKGRSLAFEAVADFKCDGEEDEKPRLYWKNKYNFEGLTKDDILAFSCELLEDLPQLRLGLHGGFLIRDSEYLSLRAAFEDVFASIECETVKVDKTGVCSVCYEKTDTKTPCGHPLCNRCWSKLKIGGEYENETSCPICRENIYFV